MTGTFSTLRFRLLVLVVIAVIPALALILYNASGDRAAASSAAAADAVRVAQHAADEQAARVESGRLMLLDLSQVYGQTMEGARGCNAIFSDLRAAYLQGYPRYANLGVIGSDGHIFCSVMRVSGPVDVNGRADYQVAARAGEFTVGQIQIDPALSEAYITLYYPVLDFSGKVRQVLFAQLDLQWLQQLAGPAATGLVEALKAQPGSGTAEIDTGGVRSLYAFTPLSGGTAPSGTRLYLSISIPARTVFARANQALVNSVLMLGLVALLALAVSWYGSDWLITRPLGELLCATQRLAQGDLSARTGLRRRPGRGEVAQLARAFDDMADTLEQRDRERHNAEAALRRSEELYRTLAHHFPNGAVLLYDHDLRHILADGAGLPDVGLSKAGLEGKLVSEVFDAETFSRLEPPYRAALEGRESQAEVAYAGRFYQVQALPLRNERGEIFAGMAVTRDITDRKRAFELLE
jgi:PAS domain S-box-containing protein